MKFNLIFECSRMEKEQIIKRALKLYPSDKIRGGLKAHIMMNLSAINGVNGNDKMDFKKLHKADDFNFRHDIIGIENNLCKETGKLLNHFVPRCAIISEEGQ